jgi:hypothetical protein
MSTTELDVSIAPGDAYRKETEIRTHFERSPRGPMWVAGIFICLLASSGIVAVVRAIPASYASIPDERAPSQDAAVPRGVEDADVNGSRSRARCPECGFVESIRHIESSGNVGAAEGVPGGAPGSAIAASAVTRKNYEITVRFRDGSTTVFNEATPRTWRLGSRVIVIGGSNAL